jgi:hypothetical protein
MGRPLLGPGLGRHRARLVDEQVDRVAGVVPEQAVGPGAGPAQRVLVLPPEEERLDHQVLQRELALGDAPVNPPVARVEAAGVAHHGDGAGALLRRHHGLGAGQAVGHGDLDQHVLARLHDLDGLGGVQLGGRRQDGGVDAGQRQHLAEVEAVPGHAELGGELGGVGRLAPGDADHLDVLDVPEGRCVPAGDRTLAGEDNPDALCHACSSTMGRVVDNSVDDPPGVPPRGGRG